MLIFDIETNGFLEQLDTIHCITIYDTDNPEEGYTRYRNPDSTIDDAIERLQSADFICGHNIIAFDIPAIKKVYPDFEYNNAIDTLTMSRYIYPDLKERDFKKRAKDTEYLKGVMMGSHALKAWGMRMGVLKDDYSGGFDEWNQDMDDYCEQDTRVTVNLFKLLDKNTPSAESFNLEHEVQEIIQRQVQRGFAFDEVAAGKLYARLKMEQEQLALELKGIFKPWYKMDKVFTPKRDNKKQGYVGGVTFTKIKMIEFNPASRDQIADRLIQLFNWKPKEFTSSSKPKVDESVLSTLRYPVASKLSRYMVLEKVIGMLAEGRQSWLRCLKNGRIHGSVNTNGAVTGRMTHSHPNVAQTPSSRKPFGMECRGLFIPSDGYLLLGCDAEGLELRALAHYMARYDGGKYAKTVVNGSKEKGTDAHTVNQKAIGLYSRDSAKTWFYAYIYGAGNEKLGSIVWEDMPKGERPNPTKGTLIQLGDVSRKKLEKNLPALGKLTEAVKTKVSAQGYLIGLDGRKLYIRSEHAALNTLLQSAGAVLMKKALVILDKDLSDAYGKDSYHFVANIHDEFQLEVNPQYAGDIGDRACKSIEKAGEYFNFRCPLAGDYAIGKSWAETH